MSTFVLVHGSNCGGWVWKKLIPLLRAAGHEVYAPTLTGLADRSHLLHCGVDLTTHITDVANLIIYEDLTEVILVGNSYGGMVITGVAAKIPEQLKLIVYLDAYLPEYEQSESDLWPPERSAAAEAAEADGLAQPPPLSLFGLNDPELMAWIDDRVSPHPVSTYNEPVPYGNAKSEAVPRVYIYCTGNPASTPDVFGPSAAKAREKGWDVYELATGHVAMLSAPLELSELLLAICNRF
ncbi:MAG: alpha/beta hydrolase [Anaerolineales bacterium]